MFLIACSSGGGGGGGEPGNSDSLTGQFLDSAVVGLYYETETQSGTTDSQGNFQYLAGETISFYVGNVLVGQTTAQEIVTPLNLVSGAVDETNAQVTNIIRFLQSLDDNNDPSDNISIILQARDLNFTVTINFAQAIDAFASDSDVADAIAAVNEAAGSSLALVSATAAQEHFRATLVSLEEDGGTIPPSETGTLSISGTDTSIFGATFTPEYSYMQNPDRPAWIIEANGRETQLWVDINPDGSVRKADFRDYAINDTLNNPFYLYQLGCLGFADCPAVATHVSVDLQAKTVTFDSLELPPFEYDGTAPITINGTLEYTGTLEF
jgi:hypothetical protein